MKKKEETQEIQQKLKAENSKIKTLMEDAIKLRFSKFTLEAKEKI